MSNYKHRKQWAGKDVKFLLYLEALHKDDSNNYPATKTEAMKLYTDQESEYVVSGFASVRISDEQDDADEPRGKAAAGEFRSGEKAEIQDAKGNLGLLSRPTHTKPRSNVLITEYTGSPPEKERRSGVKADMQDTKGAFPSNSSSDPTTPLLSPPVARRPVALTPMSTTSKKQADKYNYDNNLMTSDARTYYEATNALTPAAKKEYDYYNGKLSDSQKESYERSSGKMVLFPTPRSYPIKIFCGAGKQCGYPVNYTVHSQYPTYCNGENSKRTYCRVGTNDRVNHQCLFADVVCAHNRCLIENYNLAYVLVFHCCPVCKHHLHGGISSQYGIVFH